MTLIATPLYAGLLTVLYIALAARTIVYRRSHRISLGPGEDREMLARMRTHANCAEYAPWGLLLLLMVELQGAPLWLVHGLGSLLLVGRCVHAYALSQNPQVMPARVLGMVLTFLQLGLTAVIGTVLAMF